RVGGRGRRGRRRPFHDHSRAGRRFRHASHPPGRSGPTAVPAVRAAARPDRSPVPQDERPPATDVVSLLADGEIEIVGRMPWSSNQTFLVTCTAGEEETGAVYKPERGERHLWDFPGGIFKREIAAYELSVALGWNLVPETISRLDAPFGEGSLQQFVDADFSQHHFTLIDA